MRSGFQSGDLQPHLVEAAPFQSRQVERELHETALLDLLRVREMRGGIILRLRVRRRPVHLRGQDAQVLAAVEQAFRHDHLGLSRGNVSAEVVSVAEHVVVRVFRVRLVARVDWRFDNDLVATGREREQVAVDREPAVAAAGHHGELVEAGFLRVVVGLARVGDPEEHLEAVLAADGELRGEEIRAAVPARHNLHLLELLRRAAPAHARPHARERSCAAKMAALHRFSAAKMAALHRGARSMGSRSMGSRHLGGFMGNRHLGGAHPHHHTQKKLPHHHSSILPNYRQAAMYRGRQRNVPTSRTSPAWKINGSAFLRVSVIFRLIIIVFRLVAEYVITF